MEKSKVLQTSKTQSSALPNQLYKKFKRTSLSAKEKATTRNMIISTDAEKAFEKTQDTLKIKSLKKWV